MKEGWITKKFGDVCHYHKENGVHCGVPYIGLEHIESGTGRLLGSISSDKVLSSTFHFASGDVLYGRLRPYLQKVIVANFEGCCSTEIFPIQSTEIDSYFLKYWFLTERITNAINATSAGCRMPRGNMNEVLKFDISYPPLSEQQTIVNYLDSSFAKIDAMKANAEKALNEAKALFQAALKSLLEPLENWPKDKLENVFNFIDYRGATPKKISSGIPLVTAKNVKYGYLDYSIKDFISNAEYQQRQSRGISHKGDILFTTEAPLGNVAIADLDEFSAGQRLITLQQYPTSKYVILNRYYYYYMLGPAFQKEINDLATGATAQGIKAKLLKLIVVPIPPVDIQHSIVDSLDIVSSKISHLQSNFDKISQECDSLKQALLKQVFE